ncbi:hypothetical protein H8356DRAFT_1360794 [Neocallimastix lanati (nom. inval.)]|nr:hypothetical protein H8356DRAFT_1360794 [Neocallimastix sp. JGI-2020a]
MGIFYKQENNGVENENVGYFTDNNENNNKDNKFNKINNIIDNNQNNTHDINNIIDKQKKKSPKFCFFIYPYYDMSFKLHPSNFEDRFIELKRHLIAQD